MHRHVHEVGAQHAEAPRPICHPHRGKRPGVVRGLAFALCLSGAAGFCTAAPTDADLGLRSGGGPWQFYPAKSGDAHRARVLLIGDSIMNGYRGPVMAALADEADVDCWLTPLHLASEDLHPDLRKVLARGPYDVVHFNIGLHGWTPGRIPEGQYEPLLRAYLGVLRGGSPSAQLVWASTTPITVKGKPMELDPVHNQTILDRNAIAARVMNDCGIDVIDLYGLMGERLDLARGDGFHWQGEGYKLMAQHVVRGVLDALNRRQHRPHDASALGSPLSGAPEYDAWRASWNQ